MAKQLTLPGARSLRTRLTALLATLGVVLMSSGLVMFTAPAASAHHNTISGVASCNTDGTWTVTWTVVNSEAGKTETLSNATRVASQLNGKTVAKKGSLTATETVPNSSGRLSLSVKGTWSNGVTQTSTGYAEVGYTCEPPKQPKDEVVTSYDDRMTCLGGVEKRTIVTTKEYVWDQGAWVLEPAADWDVQDSGWVKVRDLTPAEKKQLGCYGGQPKDEVDEDNDYDYNCDGKHKRTITTTKEYILTDTGWVLEPEADWTVVDTGWVRTRGLTDAEKREYGCYGDQPKDEVGSISEDRTGCETGVEKRTVTTTKEYVLSDNGWVLEPEADWTVVDTGWVKQRDLTGAEKQQLGCYGNGPGDEVVSQSDQRSSCATGVETRTITTTKQFVLTDKGWVLEPAADWAVVDSGWVKTRDLTAAEALALGCIQGVEEIVPAVSFTDPTCESPKGADWSGTFGDAVDYAVDGKVKAGNDVTVTVALKPSAAGQYSFPVGTNTVFKHSYPSLGDLGCVLGEETVKPKPKPTKKPQVLGTEAAVPTAVAAGLGGSGTPGAGGGLVAQALTGAGLALLLAAGWIAMTGRRGVREV